MQKIGDQIKFEMSFNTAQSQLGLLQKNPSKEKADALKQRFKDMDATIRTIQEKLMGNSRLNRKDVEIRINNYKQQKAQLQKTLDTVQMALTQQQLFRNRLQEQAGPMSSQQRMRLQNRQLALGMQQQTNQIARVNNQSAGIIAQTKQEVVRQGQVIGKIQQDVDEADMQLSMIDEVMRMISNRNLLTKIILIFLVIFLGAADLIVLLIKISM